ERRHQDFRPKEMSRIIQGPALSRKGVLRTDSHQLAKVSDKFAVPQANLRSCSSGWCLAGLPRYLSRQQRSIRVPRVFFFSAGKPTEYTRDVYATLPGRLLRSRPPPW